MIFIFPCWWRKSREMVKMLFKHCVADRQKPLTTKLYKSISSLVNFYRLILFYHIPKLLVISCIAYLWHWNHPLLLIISLSGILQMMFSKFVHSLLYRSQNQYLLRLAVACLWAQTLVYCMKRLWFFYFMIVVSVMSRLIVFIKFC